MSNSARWGLVMLVVVVGLIVAIWPRGGDVGPGTSNTTPQTYGEPPSGPPVDKRGSDTDAALAGPRARAALQPCPTPQPGVTAQGPLAGVTLECLGDGSPVDVGAALAGRPALINIWAYWCAPCAEELPAMQEFARRAGSAVQVLTVHRDPGEANALDRLADLGVHLPGVQDGAGRVAAAVHAPSVLPVSVLLRADGSVAAVLPVPFTDADQIAAAVRDKLGVAV
ncbi:TlpA family protein disulfide reductase [Rhodococcus sp. D2-41]|uniref:TlpA family protein disulfide reductase n=1 Tax=Speluncibacter jeojiensis TaxID=2710754 RepID=A0A9X4M516_9ACTN|nr:TlpA disulfide reductase family protein [Rhodococcus sp. D2-41]MDG3009394.1 TlpA family protein disulfide reductase [Rhodococcus sp. D2-41]MDG3016979.1 TlpA family protein disulfide reductase [Corynebacteriales bacterium D3-21]